MAGEWIRLYTGAPPASVFEGWAGTPIVIDDAADTAYYLKGNTPTPLTGGGGGGGVTAVTATIPLASTGGATPDISMIGLSGWSAIGDSVRVDATGTAFEWYTPSAGGLLYWIESQVPGVVATLTNSVWTPNSPTVDYGIVLDLVGSTGAGALQLAIPDGTVANGDARGSGAVDLQTARSAATQVTQGPHQFMGAGQFNTITAAASYGAIVGSNASTVSATGGFIGSGSNNVVTGAHGAAFGQNQAVGAHCFAACEGNTAVDHSTAFGYGTSSSNYSFTANYLTTASGFFSAAFGSLGVSDSFYSFCIGNRPWVNGMLGAYAYSSYHSSNPGDRQLRVNLLKANTSGAVTVEATVNEAAGSATNQFNILAGAAFCSVTLHGYVHICEPATQLVGHRAFSASYSTVGGVVTMTGSVIGAYAGSAAIAAATATATADNVNGCCRLNGVGVAARDLKFNFHVNEINWR